MALKITAKIPANQKMKIISVMDDAIDWENTYPEIADMAKKKQRYSESRDLSEVQWKPGYQPTVFIFNHPKRIEHFEKVSDALMSQGISAMGITEANGIKIQSKPLMVTLMNLLYVGSQEGLAGTEEPAKRDAKGDLSEDFLQGCIDAGVMDEFVAVLLKTHQGKGSHEKK